MYKEGKVNKQHENAGLGELLLFMSLTMDGLTGAIQVPLFLYCLLNPYQILSNFASETIFFRATVDF
jgi:hypothetical protein